MVQTSDEVLAQRAQADDQQALTTLYRRHLNAIYRFIIYPRGQPITGGGSHG